jgi:hypothetical protein
VGYLSCTSCMTAHAADPPLHSVPIR